MSTQLTWNNFSKSLYSSEKLGLYLDLSNAGISEHDFQQLEPNIQKALSHMDALEQGALANPDEKRQVGHYWLRNPEIAPTSPLRIAIQETIDGIQAFAQDILAGKIRTPDNQEFSELLLIGIGGSALGPQFISEALGTSNGLRIHFFDNTDPDGMDRTLETLEQSISKTLVLVISKSGGTAETRNGMLEAKHFFLAHGLEMSKQAVAITGEGSHLYTIAQDEEWLSIFPMWDWVGGRTSAMSAVGLLPAALMGIDIHSFLRGASEMDVLTRSKDTHQNPAALLALAWFIVGAGTGDKDMVILPYKDRLLLFSRYLQQLIMESLGKSHDLNGDLVQQGIAVYGNKGSTDQHAYVQQLRDGLNNFFVTFIEVLSDRQGESILMDGKNNAGDYLFGFFKGTQTALSENNRQSITITVSDVSPESVGALIALYERAVGLYASMVNINAYHQPGVEAGKKAAGYVLETKNRIIETLNSTDDALSVKELCSILNIQGQEILVYQILRHHAANHPLEIKGSFFDPTSLMVRIP